METMKLQPKLDDALMASAQGIADQFKLPLPLVRSMIYAAAAISGPLMEAKDDGDEQKLGCIISMYVDAYAASGIAEAFNVDENTINNALIETVKHTMAAFVAYISGQDPAEVYAMAEQEIKKAFH